MMELATRVPLTGLPRYRVSECVADGFGWTIPAAVPVNSPVFQPGGGPALADVPAGTALQMSGSPTISNDPASTANALRKSADFTSR